MVDNNDKDASTWGRDALIFGAGVVTGVVGTVVTGHFLPSVPVPGPLNDMFKGTGTEPAKK
jgi:hypothetical protein